MHQQIPPTFRHKASCAQTRWSALAVSLLLATLLAGCAAPAARLAVFDFGPGATSPLVSNRMARVPLMLSDVEASSALDSTAVLYRLLYSDAQQLRPYAQARWSMPPAQLLRQRLRESLGQQRSVLAPGDAMIAGTLVLRLELEEFSQLFESAQSSTALVRVRATLSRSGSPARLLAQTSFVQQQPGRSADAAGGVQALAQASDALVLQMDEWLQQIAAAETTAP